MDLIEQKRRLAMAMQEGLPLTSRPFRAIGERVEMSEKEIIGLVRDCVDEGVIKRIGVVVRHHELGFSHNAMVVWNVPDDVVDEVGEWLGKQSSVTLCYRRPRQAPFWPYNLYCMIHGRDREWVRARIEDLCSSADLCGVPHAVLFSRRRFKQRGARYGFEAGQRRIVNA